MRETRSEIRSVMATPGFAPLCCVILGDSTPLSELHRTAIETEGIKYDASFSLVVFDIKLETRKHTSALSTREGLRWAGLCGQGFVLGV